MLVGHYLATYAGGDAIAQLIRGIMKKALFAALLGLVSGGCATAPTVAEFESAYFGEYPGDYEGMIKGYMAQRLKDPESARYQFLNAPRKAWNGFGGRKYGWAVCATINGKNSYGGYVGNRPSYFLLRDGLVVDSMHGDGQYGDAMVQGLCKPFV